MEIEDWNELERRQQPAASASALPPPSPPPASAPDTQPVEGGVEDEEGEEDNPADIEMLIQTIRAIYEILLTKDEVER
jgi:hypothetical protein